jgi:hypothetical protein
MRSNGNGGESPDANAIRKIVWDGPYVETDQGKTIRGSVGLTYGGQYRAAQVSLYEEHGHSGRVSFSGESYHWDARSYPHKEQAIFAAREGVQRAVRRDQRPEKLGNRRTKSSAEKYGAADYSQHELKQHSRSR